MALKSFAPHTLNGQPRRANASVTVILFVNIPRLGAPAVPQGPPQQLFATFPSTRCASVRRPLLKVMCNWFCKKCLIEKNQVMHQISNHFEQRAAHTDLEPSARACGSSSFIKL